MAVDKQKIVRSLKRTAKIAGIWFGIFLLGVIETCIAKRFSFILTGLLFGTIFYFFWRVLAFSHRGMRFVASKGKKW